MNYALVVALGNIKSAVAWLEAKNSPLSSKLEDQYNKEVIRLFRQHAYFSSDLMSSAEISEMLTMRITEEHMPRMVSVLKNFTDEEKTIIAEEIKKAGVEKPLLLKALQTSSTP